MLRVEILHVLDNLLAVKQAIEEVDQQFLVGSSAEYALETEVGQQTDVSFFYCCHILYLFILLQKYEVFLKSARKQRKFLYIRDIVCDNPTNHGVG